MSRRRSLSRGRPSVPSDFVLVEPQESEARPHLGLLNSKDNKLRKQAYKQVKAVFASYQEDFNATLNVLPSAEWEADTKTNFLHVPFKIDTFPSAGLFEYYFQNKHNDGRARVEYDGGDQFILKLDWRQLLVRSDTSPWKKYRQQGLVALLVIVLFFFWWLWSAISGFGNPNLPNME